MRGILFNIVYLSVFSFTCSQSYAQLAGAGPKIVSCKEDSVEKYSLYLPAGYKVGNIFPLLIFFDPFARGNVPVERYKQVADKYGIIMAGCMNSRNFDGEGSLRSFVAVYNDIISSYRIDPAKTWLSGFSGGARISTTLASEYKEITGVIACGAGFADNGTIDSRKKFSFAGIVGEEDMNYEEILLLNKNLDERRKENMFLVFPGAHQWPPLHYFETAVFWLNRRSVQLHPSLLTPVYQVLNFITSKIDSGYTYSAWLQLNQLRTLPFINAEIDSIIKVLETGKTFNNDRNLFNEIISSERLFIYAVNILFNQSFTSGKEPLEFEIWRNKASMIDFKDKSGYELFSMQRRSNYCISVCSEYYRKFMDGKEYSKAISAASIAKYFKPKHFNPEFLLAKAWAALGDKDQASAHLVLAVHGGLRSSPQVYNDPHLSKMFSKDALDALFIKN